MIGTTGGMNQAPFAVCGSTPWLVNRSAANTTLIANPSTIPRPARTATRANVASADRTDGPTVAIPTASTRRPAGNVACSAPTTGFDEVRPGGVGVAQPSGRRTGSPSPTARSADSATISTPNACMTSARPATCPGFW